MNQPRPIHPGEILREDFLPEYGLTAGSLAKALLVPRDRIERIIRGSRALTADTAARLARFFGSEPAVRLYSGRKSSRNISPG